jgi:hypothetical protein
VFDGQALLSNTTGITGENTDAGSHWLRSASLEWPTSLHRLTSWPGPATTGHDLLATTLGGVASAIVSRGVRRSARLRGKALPGTMAFTGTERPTAVGLPSNKGMNLTKRGAFLAGGRALTSLRRSSFTKSRFAAYARCSAGTTSITAPGWQRR